MTRVMVTVTNIETHESRTWTRGEEDPRKLPAEIGRAAHDWTARLVGLPPGMEPEPPTLALWDDDGTSA